jgi:hypothetical protein
MNQPHRAQAHGNVIMTDKNVWISRETVVVYFKVPSRYSVAETEEDSSTVNQEQPVIA